MGTAFNSDYLIGLGTVDERMLILVDIDKLMSSGEMGLIDKLRNEAKQKPVSQATTELQQQLLQGIWSSEAKLAVLEDLTVEDLREFAGRFIKKLDPVMLVHGNLTEAAALNMQRQVHAILLEDTEIVEVPRSGVRAVPDGEHRITLEVDHPDTGYALYLQGQSTEFDERARYLLLAQMIGAPFYESLRTQQQLGYIVSASPYEMLEVPALGMIVQSPSADAATIDAAVTAFLKTFEQTLAGFSKAELEQEKQAVISKLMAKDRQLGEITQRYWQEIDRGVITFDSREELAKAVEETSLISLLNLYHDEILPRSHALRVDTDPSLPDSGKTGEDVIKALQSAPFID
jgi:secreted Zn-dependent insulinase-like peptidase